MRILLIGLLGYTFVSQQVSAQTDSIASRHELKNVTVKATNGIKSTSTEAYISTTAFQRQPFFILRTARWIMTAMATASWICPTYV